MRLDLSHLEDHKFRHDFQDCLNPICSCRQEIETTSHFLLHYLSYCCARKTFFEKFNLIDSNILQQSDLSATKDLLFGSEKLKDDKKCLINVCDWLHLVHGEIQIPVVSIINNRLDWHLLYKPFNGNFLIVMKVIDYCITPSISHLHFFCVCWSLNKFFHR